MPLRIGVRSMTTVTYRSPLRVCLQACSSTPMVVTPSNRPGSAIRTRRPSASTASLAVSHATSRASATRATVTCWSTSASNAHRTADRVSFAFGAAAAVVSWRHTRRQVSHRYRRTVTASVVGRHPNGSCASRRTTVSRDTPSQPQRRHDRVASVSVDDLTGQDRPVRLEPLPGHHQAKVVEAAEGRQIGADEGSVEHVEVFLMGGVGTPILGRPRPSPPHRRADHPLTRRPPPTPSIGMSPFTAPPELSL